jgi:hypothetical protein
MYMMGRLEKETLSNEVDAREEAAASTLKITSSH